MTKYIFVLNWETHQVNFEKLENILNAVYIVELGMRLWVFGRRFPKKPENLMDAFIVVSSCLDADVLRPGLGPRAERLVAAWAVRARVE